MAESIHDQLRARRIALGITQGEVARRSGVPQHRVSFAERGGDVMLSTLLKLAHALDLELFPVPIEALARVRNVIGVRTEATIGHVPSMLERYGVSDDDEEPRHG